MGTCKYIKHERSIERFSISHILPAGSWALALWVGVEGPCRGLNHRDKYITDSGTWADVSGARTASVPPRSPHPQSADVRPASSAPGKDTPPSEAAAGVLEWRGEMLRWSVERCEGDVWQRWRNGVLRHFAISRWDCEFSDIESVSIDTVNQSAFAFEMSIKCKLYKKTNYVLLLSFLSRNVSCGKLESVRLVWHQRHRSADLNSQTLFRCSHI